MTQTEPETPSLPSGSDPFAVRFSGLRLRYGKTLALDGISLDVPAGRLVGLIGPDGVGKSSLLSLVTGVHVMQEGTLSVLGGDMRSPLHRAAICPRIAYMPQGLGKNLYFTLTVEENLQFFARLFGHGPAERRKRIDHLTKSTGLYPFLDRPAGKLSGGMKQKLGLCCSLIHDPDLLVLDEPTTGVDPLARRQFWDLIDSIRKGQPTLSVMVATAYMDEAQRFDWLIAMNDGKILDTGTPKELLDKTGTDNLDSAFIRLLPESKRANHKELVVPPLPAEADNDISIEAEGLTKKFGSFTAVDHVSFRIRRGEIFGFLGSNGCGKTTTMRMLTGLIPATEGTATLFGVPIDGNSLEVRKNLGYMTQLFSLYNELTVRQNLELYAKLYGIPEREVSKRVDNMMTRFDLRSVENNVPPDLPLGIKQRLSLAAAVIHNPKILILDEPTSGVDPVARDTFWELIIELSRRDKVTIFVTTHFMNEAERCDRISLMHAGRSLACDSPASLVAARKAATLEDAFIGCLEEAAASAAGNTPAGPQTDDTEEEEAEPEKVSAPEKHSWLGTVIRENFDFQRWYTCFWRETLELKRDGIRATLALFGALILMVVMGYGITTDVVDLPMAILDEDQSVSSIEYCWNFDASRYFKLKEPIRNYEELDRRMVNGELGLVIHIPPKFGRDLQNNNVPDLAVWIDGAMPSRADTINGYVQSVHAQWASNYLSKQPDAQSYEMPDVQTRYRYNPEVLSLPAMVPAVIPILLMMIPAVLAALSVVREKELGSIINLYATPLSRFEFLLGKQMPYVILAFFSSITLILLAVFLFRVPVKGSLPLLLISLFLYCILSTGFGMIASSVTKSQIAVIFLTMVATILPATQLCGLMNPIASQSGVSYAIGMMFPTTHMLLISRGVFNKALGFSDMFGELLWLILEIPPMVLIGVMLQKKQEQ